MVFTELLFNDKKLVKYTLREGFDALFRRSKLSLVPEVGIEPTSRKGHDFKSCVYTSSTTRA